MPLTDRKRFKEFRSVPSSQAEGCLITLEDAIKKMTGMNADKISIPDRGSLKAGYWGDVAVFDPNTIAYKVTYENPHQYSVGVQYVVVNG